MSIKAVNFLRLLVKCFLKQLHWMFRGATSLARSALDTNQNEINDCPPLSEFSFLRGYEHADVGVFGEHPLMDSVTLLSSWVNLASSLSTDALGGWLSDVAGRPFLTLHKQKSGSRTRFKEGNYITLLNKEALGRTRWVVWQKCAPPPLVDCFWDLLMRSGGKVSVSGLLP